MPAGWAWVVQPGLLDVPVPSIYEIGSRIPQLRGISGRFLPYWRGFRLTLQCRAWLDGRRGPGMWVALVGVKTGRAFIQ